MEIDLVEVVKDFVFLFAAEIKIAAIHFILTPFFWVEECCKRRSS